MYINNHNHYKKRKTLCTREEISRGSVFYILYAHQTKYVQRILIWKSKSIFNSIYIYILQHIFGIVYTYNCVTHRSLSIKDIYTLMQTFYFQKWIYHIYTKKEIKYPGVCTHSQQQYFSRVHTIAYTTFLLLLWLCFREYCVMIIKSNLWA